MINGIIFKVLGVVIIVKFFVRFVLLSGLIISLGNNFLVNGD